MSLPQKSVTVLDPITDPRVKKIELVYQRFLDTLDELNQEQRQIITEAMSELNHRQIESIRSKLNNQHTHGSTD